MDHQCKLYDRGPPSRFVDHCRSLTILIFVLIFGNIYFIDIFKHEKVELVKVRKQNRFYARKRVAKTKINKKDMQLEKQIMQQQDCKFIVKLYYTLADQYYVYLLMVSHLFESYNMTYIIWVFTGR